MAKLTTTPVTDKGGRVKPKNKAFQTLNKGSDIATPYHQCPTVKKEENISAGVGFLVLLIVFLLGNLLGHWVSNQLREPTWHSPKGCPIYVGGTNGK